MLFVGTKEGGGYTFVPNNGDYNKLRKMCFKIFLSKKSLVKLNVTSPDGWA